MSKKKYASSALNLKYFFLLLIYDLKLYAVLATDIDVTNFNSALKCIEEWANTWQLLL